MPVSYVPLYALVVCSWLAGYGGLCTVRQWINCDAKWYEWGILFAAMAAFIFSFIAVFLEITT